MSKLPFPEVNSAPWKKHEGDAGTYRNVSH